jgi:hypothetical protein
VILLDTNVLVYFLHRVEPYASKAKEILVEEEDLAITLRILDELLFALIRLEAWRSFGIRKLEELRNFVRKRGIKVFDDVMNDVKEFVEKLNIVVLEDKGSFQEVLEAMRKYDLLPGDAIIAVTAKHYSIRRIATFDQDFKKVPWLEVIP